MIHQKIAFTRNFFVNKYFYQRITHHPHHTPNNYSPPHYVSITSSVRLNYHIITTSIHIEHTPTTSVSPSLSDCNSAWIPGPRTQLELYWVRTLCGLEPMWVDF